MEYYETETFNLPIPGHYECGYGYGFGPAQPLRHETRRLERTSYIADYADYNSAVDVQQDQTEAHVRPRSPPVIIPNNFLGIKEEIEPEQDDASINSRSRQSSTQSSTPSSAPSSTPSAAQSAATSISFSEPMEITIAPDLLPQHSNPQHLSPTQCAAFSGPRPIQPMCLHKRGVLDSYTGEPIFDISDETIIKISKQSLYQIHESGSSAIIGTIGFEHDTPNEIVAIFHGRDIVLKKDRAYGSRWCFKPSVLTKKAAYWYWYKDKSRDGVILSDAKKNGQVVARIQRDVLSIEKPGLALDTVNEILIGAIALAEFARRNSEDDELRDLAAAIAVTALGESLDGQNDEGIAEPQKKLRRRLTINL